MNNYRSIIRTELANNSRGNQHYVERDLSRYTSTSSSAWDEAPDAYDVTEEDFFSSDEDDDDMACMFF